MLVDDKFVGEMKNWTHVWHTIYFVHSLRSTTILLFSLPIFHRWNLWGESIICQNNKVNNNINYRHKIFRPMHHAQSRLYSMSSISFLFQLFAIKLSYLKYAPFVQIFWHVFDLQEIWYQKGKSKIEYKYFWG